MKWQWQRKNGSTCQQNAFQCHTVNNKSNMDWPGNKSGLFSKRPVTNCLCYCRAIWLAIWSSHNTLQKQPLVPTGLESENPKAALNIVERWKIPCCTTNQTVACSQSLIWTKLLSSTLYALYICLWYDNFISAYKKFKCHEYYRHNCLTLLYILWDFCV